MSHLGDHDVRRAKALIARKLERARKINALKSLIQSAGIVAHSRNLARYRLAGFRQDPGRFAGLDALYRRTDDETRRVIAERYAEMLTDMLQSPAPGVRPLKIDFDALPLPARPYLLAPYLSMVVGHAFPRLDLLRSDTRRGVLVYVHAGGAVDEDAWWRQLGRISAWLGDNWQIAGQAATTIALVRRQSLPRRIPMQARFVAADALCTGLDTDSGMPAHIPIRDLSSGTLIVGASGSGKSNATHVLMQSILANLAQFQAVFCIDGKEGLTFARYSLAAPEKIRILVEEADVWRLVERLVEVVRKRNARLRDQGLDSAPDQFIAVMIEEMSHYTAKPATDDKAELKAHAKFIHDLATLARRGRSAGLKVFVTAQDPTDNQVPTTVRSNCQTIISFRVPVDAHAIMLFGQLDGLPADPRKLPCGRALIKRDDGTITSVQFPVIPQPGGRA